MRETNDFAFKSIGHGDTATWNGVMK